MTKDPFSASITFNIRQQKDGERTGDFVIELTKLFKQAYHEETTMSVVLLQRFVTGLRPSLVVNYFCGRSLSPLNKQ